jgi:translation initiation factor 2 subunit 2
MFADLKKKKKKKKAEFDDFEAGLKNDDEIVFGADPGMPETITEDVDAWVGTNRDYTYTELLSRVCKILRQKNPELQGEKKRYTIAPPQILREGTKKTVFANIVDIAKHMRRQPDHLIQFLFAEMGTSGSIDGTQRLVIKGRFQQKQIESILKRYIVEYVTCKTCKSADTILVKENRLFFMQCESCGSSRSVSAIKTGFMAQTGRRAKPAT